MRALAPLILSVGWACLGLSFMAPLAAQTSVDGLSTASATLGTVFTVSGTGFGSKPKVFLAQENVKVKKTKLKVLSVDTAGETETITVEVRKALLGSFQIGVRPKGQDMPDTFSSDVIEIVAPLVLSVLPSSASPGDTITVRVQNPGNRKLRGTIFKKAKLLGSSVVPSEGDAELLDVMLRVPKIPNGVHNVRLRNPLGGHRLKAALTITGSNFCPGKPRASVEVDGKSFKSKKIEVTKITEGLLISAKTGGKTSRVVNVILPFDPDIDSVPQHYFVSPASIEYIEKLGANPSTSWRTNSGDGFQVIVNAFECDSLVITLCGPLTLQGAALAPEILPFEGTFVVKLESTAMPPQECEAMFGQVGGVAFLADLVVASYLPEFTTTLIAGIDTPLDASFSIDLAYNAFTEAARVFDVIGFGELVLFQHTDNGEDFFAFVPVPGQPGSSVTLEILTNDGSCLTGLFSGSVKQPITGEIRTFNTFHFEATYDIIN